MTTTITITVDGSPHELQASYLTPAALEYWTAWLQYEARATFNPWIEFADKIKALPAELRAAAVEGFSKSLSFDNVPLIHILDMARTERALHILCALVTCQDVITAENAAEAYAKLVPFIRREEIAVESIEEANRLRAAVGKPPIGG